MRNKYIVGKEVAVIFVPYRSTLNKHLFGCVVDASDLPKLKNYDVMWVLTRGRYIVAQVERSSGHEHIFLHRVVNGTPEGLKTDHIDGNTLNNRRSNLRGVTHAVNLLNRIGEREGKTSGLPRGVRRSGSRFAAVIQGQRREHLGQFDTPIEAACAVKRRLTELDPIAGANYNMPEGF